MNFIAADHSNSVSDAEVPMLLRCCVVLAALAACTPWPARASGAAPIAGAALQGTLLASSRAIKQQEQALQRARVHRLLCATSSSDVFVWSPPELRTAELVMEVDAMRVATRTSAPSAIPFGFAGIAWALRHPGAAWRLIFPVLA